MYQQLLAVLPSASAHLLPEPFRLLMSDPRSPVLDFYPAKFDVDLEGKRQDWEGVVLIPFIEVPRLLAAEKQFVKQEASALSGWMHSEGAGGGGGGSWGCWHGGGGGSRETGKDAVDCWDIAGREGTGPLAPRK